MFSIRMFSTYLSAGQQPDISSPLSANFSTVVGVQWRHFTLSRCLLHHCKGNCVSDFLQVCWPLLPLTLLEPDRKLVKC